VGGVPGSLALDDRRQKHLEGGGLDRTEVMYEYHTQQDDRVRPSHAALEGTTWDLGDPFAPVPPCGINCRCWMTYVAKPKSAAAQIIPEATNAPKPVAKVYAEHLDKTIPDWRDMIEATADVERSARLLAIVALIKAKHASHTADAKDLALMMIEASRTKDRK
jgi:hypothetical protein